MVLDRFHFQGKWQTDRIESNKNDKIQYIWLGPLDFCWGLYCCCYFIYETCQSSVSYYCTLPLSQRPSQPPLTHQHTHAHAHTLTQVTLQHINTPAHIQTHYPWMLSAQMQCVSPSLSEKQRSRATPDLWQLKIHFSTEVSRLLTFLKGNKTGPVGGCATEIGWVLGTTTNCQMNSLQPALQGPPFLSVFHSCAHDV